MALCGALQHTCAWFCNGTMEALHNKCMMKWMGCIMRVYSPVTCKQYTKQHHACSSLCVGKHLQHHVPCACMITPWSCTKTKNCSEALPAQIKVMRSPKLAPPLSRDLIVQHLYHVCESITGTLLCSMFQALFSVCSMFCSMPATLCSVLSMLCSMSSMLCSMLATPCSMQSMLCSMLTKLNWWIRSLQAMCVFWCTLCKVKFTVIHAWNISTSNIQSQLLKPKNVTAIAVQHSSFAESGPVPIFSSHLSPWKYFHCCEDYEWLQHFKYQRTMIHCPPVVQSEIQISLLGGTSWHEYWLDSK